MGISDNVGAKRTATFAREDDGSVSISGIDPLNAIILSAEEWVEVVASVTPVGSTTATRAAAWRLHGL